MDLSVTGFQNAKLSEAARKRIVQPFAEKGQSQHSGRAETVWAILEFCRREGIPYRVEVSRFEGRPVGARVVRTDRELEALPGKVPAGWMTEVVEEWRPESVPGCGCPSK